MFECILSIAGLSEKISGISSQGGGNFSIYQPEVLRRLIGQAAVVLDRFHVSHEK